jgi:hypothetical protein
MSYFYTNFIQLVQLGIEPLDLISGFTGLGVMKRLNLIVFIKD